MSHILSDAVRYLQHPQIKGSVKSILAVQLAHANNDGTNMFPSINTVAEQTSLCKRAVYKGMKILKNILLEEDKSNRYRMKKYRLKNEQFVSLLTNQKVKKRVITHLGGNNNNCTNMNELCAEYDKYCINMNEQNALEGEQCAPNSINYSINLGNTKNKQHAREAAPEIKVIEPSKAEPSIGLTTDYSFSESVLEEKIPDEEPMPKAAKPRSEKTKTSSQQKFELFWLAYLLKVGKGAAVRAFERAIKKVPLDTILAALEAQKAERAERERLGIWTPSWKHPATWLNQECWNDVPKIAEEMQKEVEAKQVMKNSIGQKKQNFMERHTENMRIMDDITMKYFPEFGKYFGTEKRVAMRNAAQNQTRQEIVINGI